MTHTSLSKWIVSLYFTGSVAIILTGVVMFFREMILRSRKYDQEIRSGNFSSLESDTWDYIRVLLWGVVIVLGVVLLAVTAESVRWDRIMRS